MNGKVGMPSMLSELEEVIEGNNNLNYFRRVGAEQEHCQYIIYEL